MAATRWLNGRVCIIDGCDRINTVGYGLCQGHYSQRRRGHPITPLDNRHKYGRIEDPRAYLQSKITIDPVSGCWLWPGAKKYGYALGLRTRMNADTTLVHRLAWMLYNGPIPGGLTVHHRCAVSRCCNPEHLQLVTTAENTAEMVMRRALLTRIRLLEDALADLAPDHHLLEDSP